MEYRTITISISEYLSDYLADKDASGIVELALMNLLLYHDVKSDG